MFEIYLAGREIFGFGLGYKVSKHKAMLRKS
jgi:hypothetical protein